MTTDTSPTKDARPYHHGDLPRALLEAAVEAIAEVGPAAVSLRDLARRAGVSHAAPAHHFGDKAGLLTAVAADGFRRLAATLGETYQATGSFLELGVAYVRFAVTHRAHFEVMFRPELYHTDDPELIQAREQARSLLYPPAAEAANRPHGDDDLRAGVAAWSLVHGLATLWLNQNLPPELGEDPEQIAREVAHYLF
ncbi:MAG TPA: TetR/AcrR family transcriptional regulator [Actinomycetota bacterium]|nr:TetR/AcrR family transcriptional regulator [Actinomycetota bacterium]